MSAARLGVAWRTAALVGLVAGLAVVSPLGTATDIGTRDGLALAAAVLCGVALARPRRGGAGAAAWLSLVALVSAVAGIAIASARLAAIDGGALALEPGAQVELRGTVASHPRTAGDLTRFILDTPSGRIAIEASSPPKVGNGSLSDRFPTLAALDEGAEVLVAGRVRPPSPWQHAQIERLGSRFVLAADYVEATGASRGGLRGALDDVRRRAEAGLERGTPPIASALLRGFVLGQDDRIPEEVREEFRRSGLAHVLAVSGQNVMLLAILATPLLALAGVPLRARLIAIALIIAVYVPVAGAGASIQRAGVMGIAGVVAALASRPRARWYALGVAAAVTLVIDPRATAEIGWQLSFAAVAGLLVLTQPIADLLAASNGGTRRALAEGAAMTIAATLATAPLAAHHFGTVSLTALPANLIALPAIAPAMWLGMLAGALGQIPSAPLEPLTWLGGLCAAFIAWVARTLGSDWAQLDVSEPAAVIALVWTLVLLGVARTTCLVLERRRSLSPPIRPRRLILGAGVLAATLGVATLLPGSSEAPRGKLPGLTMRILDVGQGDAILLQPRGHLPVLVDTGPPGGGTADRLGELGISELEAVAITHDELDHSGALDEVLGVADARNLLVAHAPPRACRSLACPPAIRLAAGSRLRVGPLRAEVLWPRPGSEPSTDPNQTALVLAISHRGFDALLTADAEAEATSYAAHPVEFLKVAHHGSADAGLDALLSRITPAAAAISSGAGNPHGHPAPETVAVLADHRVPILRTDEQGEIVIEVWGDGWAVR